MLLLMILGAAQTDASAGGSAEILLPPEHIATDADHVYVIGRSDAPVVELALNGQVIRAVVPKDSIFHALLWFGYGLNEITATPVYSDRPSDSAAGDTIEVLSGPNVENKYERLFTPYTFHNSNPWPQCVDCHDYSLSDPGILDSGDLCYDCHNEIKNRFRTHIPDNDRACVFCHQIMADLTKSSTGTYADINPCYSCHTDKIGQFAQDYIHGPVAGGSCTICHDPHGSGYEKSLVTSVPALCPTCHDMGADQRLRVKHRPFEEGHCSACHDPHSTNNRWVLVKESQEVCMSCHEEMGTLQTHNHPYNVKPKRRLASSLALTDSGQLECLSCHNPHATDAEHLLRSVQKNTCIGCHPDR